MSPPDATAEAVEGASLCVAVVTYRRPALLARLLEQLAEVSDPRWLRWQTVLVVDNSPEPSVDSVAGTAVGAVPVRYVHEATPGIAAARNRALAEAGSDFVAFIDDDEIPSAQWLLGLEAALHRHPGALAVVGPVVPVYDRPAPQWVHGTGVFDVIALDPDRPPPYLGTGNVLLASRVRAVLDPVFEPVLGLLGGSDHYLGQQLNARRLPMASAPDAVVFESVSPERLELGWILRRLRRKGSSVAVTAMLLADGPRFRMSSRARWFAAGAIRATAGVVLAVVGPITGSSPWRGLALSVRGIGQIEAAIDRPVAEYARPESPS